MTERVGIVGCGWLGRAIAEDLVESGVHVVGTTTTLENARALESVGVEALVASFSPDLRGDVSALRQIDAVVVAVPPGREFDPVCQAESITSVIAATTATRIVQISTTSVYPATGGRVIEQDAISDHRYCRVENAYLSLNRSVTNLRCAGLFGPGRLILPFLLRSGVAVEESTPVNLVERSDVVRAVRRVIESPSAGAFNICADEHPSKGSFYLAIAKRAGLGVPDFRSTGEPFKIVDNQKFKRTYGFEYSHPDPIQFPVRS